MRTLWLMTAALLAAPAVATGIDRDGLASAARAESLLAGKVAGRPQDCVEARNADRMILQPSYVLLTVSRGLVYRSDLNGCATVRYDDRLQRLTSGSPRVCRNDVVQVYDRDSTLLKGACSFGAFTPYRTAAR